jgi:acetaldehyde dehydrogenase
MVSLFSIRVQGLGDYLPKYAGNLDIINSAAIAIAEEFAKNRLDSEIPL